MISTEENTQQLESKVLITAEQFKWEGIIRKRIISERYELLFIRVPAHLRRIVPLNTWYMVKIFSNSQNIFQSILKLGKLSFSFPKEFSLNKKHLVGQSVSIEICVS